MEVYLQSFLNSVMYKGKWLAVHPDRCAPSTLSTRGYVWPTAGVDVSEKRRTETPFPPLLRLQIKSLNQLSYPGSEYNSGT